MPSATDRAVYGASSFTFDSSALPPSNVNRFTVRKSRTRPRLAHVSHWIGIVEYAASSCRSMTSANR